VGRWATGTALVAVLALLAWLGANVRIGVIVSDSMDPTLVRGDVYIIRTDAYRHRTPRDRDVVVIKHPEASETLVKRVVGVGGDEVGVALGHVWRNGERIPEPYLVDKPGVRERPLLTVVPEGQLFLLGDNRNFSEDSRDLGTLPVSHVVGRVSAIILPWHRRHRL
jgi:signal peptidase I